METKFYYCPICGNVLVKMVDSGVTPHCCGKQMVELVPGLSNGDGEKHLPVVDCKRGGKVKIKVGEIPHPMINEHHIKLIVLETDNWLYIKRLKAGEKPEADFIVGDEKPVAAYSYCNIHGLWKTFINC